MELGAAAGVDEADQGLGAASDGELGLLTAVDGNRGHLGQRWATGCLEHCSGFYGND